MVPSKRSYTLHHKILMTYKETNTIMWLLLADFSALFRSTMKINALNLFVLFFKFKLIDFGKVLDEVS